MFTLREIAVALTFFVVVYCLLSAIVSISWRGLRGLRIPNAILANLLFLMRVAPLAISTMVALILVVPSFQLLEPHSTDEGVGELPIALGIAAVVLIGWGCHRVISAQLRSSRMVARWVDGSQPLNIASNVLALRSRNDAPPLLLAGLRKPRVLVSDATFELLSADELEMAMRHELAHIRAHDNPKKLICRFCPFPGMAVLESAWAQATELSADDAAVTEVNDALNLAAALVKLSRLVPVAAAPACTVGFVSGSIGERVKRLLAWEESQSECTAHLPRWTALPTAALGFLAMLAYGPLLSMTHEVTEWLVR